MKAVGEERGKSPAQVRASGAIFGLGLQRGWLCCHGGLKVCLASLPAGGWACEVNVAGNSEHRLCSTGPKPVLQNPALCSLCQRPQVALNWIICKGAVPIPGAKNKRQVDEIAGAVGWRLSEGEVLELERQADKIETPLGAPFENW